MTANQYSYPPPPPPPPPQVGPPVGYPQYHQSPYNQQAPRGGGRGRGRGNHGQGGRGDFHGSAPYSHHAGGYNGPAQVGGGYVQQNPASYIGPQPAGPAPPNGYPPPQWQSQHHQPPHPQQHQPQMHQAPAPVPLSAQNYHPNYAPQVYQQPQPQQPQTYGPPQQSFHQSPPQNPYIHPSHSQAPHPSGPLPQQWQGPPHQAQTPYNGGGRGRGRGNGPTRGGFEAPLMGPPIRMGFGNDRQVEPMPQASNGYPPPYANPHSSPPLPYAQPVYQGYSPNFPQKSMQRQSLEPNPFYSSGSYRGRGGMNNRGKRDASGMDKRFRPGKSRQFSGPSSHGFAPDLPQKPAVDDGAKLGDGKKKKKKKRKTNTLGLTPRNEEYEESEEEDDVDEENRLAVAIANADGLREPSDLAAWLAERRQKWPTKARRETKEADLAKRRAEQSAKDKARVKKDRDGRDVFDAAQMKLDISIGESELEKQQRKAEKLRKKLEKAEKKVQDAMKAGTKRKRETRDDGDDESEVGNSNGEKMDVDLVDQVIAKATAVTEDGNEDGSDSNASSSSEDDSSSDSDDSGPQTQTSRRTAPTRVLPPKKEILSRQCKYFSTGGVCGKKGKCRFVHDQSVRDAALREKELNGGRMTLAQRLVQNDKEKDDLMVVKSIQYLYERGVLNSPQGASAYYNDQSFDETYQQSYHDGLHDHMQPYESYGEMKVEIMDGEV